MGGLASLAIEDRYAYKACQERLNALIEWALRRVADANANNPTPTN